MPTVCTTNRPRGARSSKDGEELLVRETDEELAAAIVTLIQQPGGSCASGASGARGCRTPIHLGHQPAALGRVARATRVIAPPLRGESMTLRFEIPRNVPDICRVRLLSLHATCRASVRSEITGICAGALKSISRIRFQGKRALDVGAASGYLTFEMEKRGASVVSFDLSDGGDWDCVPFAHPDFDLQKLVRDLKRHINRIKNAYWYAHRVLAPEGPSLLWGHLQLPGGIGILRCRRRSGWCCHTFGTHSARCDRPRGCPANG